MVSTRLFGSGFAAMLLAVFALPATAQSFKVAVPHAHRLHPLVALPQKTATGRTRHQVQQLGGATSGCKACAGALHLE